MGKNKFFKLKNNIRSMFEVTEMKTQAVNVSKLIAFWENIANEKEIIIAPDNFEPYLERKIPEETLVSIRSQEKSFDIQLKSLESDSVIEKTITLIGPSIQSIKELGLTQEIINVHTQIQNKQEATGVLVSKNSTYIQETCPPRSVKTMFLAVHHLDTTDEIQRENEYLARIYQENPKLVKVRGRRKGKVTFLLPEVFADILYERKDIIDY